MKDLFLCLDIGGTNLKSALINSENEIISRHSTVNDGLDDESLIRHLDSHLAEYKTFLSEASIKSAGISVAGIPTIDRKGIRATTHLKQGELAISKIIKEKLGVPSLVDNDGQCMALGEKFYGLAREAENFYCLSLGTGIGGGCFVGGHLLRGHNGGACEFGHILIDVPSKKACGCGVLGCFEAHASARALEQEYASRTGESLDARKIADLARNMENDAVFVFKKVGTFLGRGIAILNNCFNPELVILSGGLANAYDLLEEDLLNEMQKITYMRKINQFPQIKISSSSGEAGIFGALHLAKECLH